MPFASKEEAIQHLLSRGYTREQINQGIAARKAAQKPQSTRVMQPEDTTLESVSKDAGSLVGELGGGMYGASVGRPDIGAAVGAGIGRGVVDAAQDLPELMAGDIDPNEYIWGVGQETARGAGESVVGNTLFKSARWAAAPFVRSVSPQAKEFIEYMHARLPELPRGNIKQPIQSLVNQGRRLLGVTKPAAATPDVLTDNYVLDLTGNIVRTTMFGGGTVRALDARNSRILGEYAEDIGKAFGKPLPRDKFGGVVEAAINDRLSAAEMARQTAKNTTTQLGSGIDVDLTSVARPIRRAVRVGRAVSADPEDPINLIDKFEQDMLDKLGPSAPIDAVMEFRDVLRVKGHAELVPGLDKAISRSLKKNKQALKAFKDYQQLETLTGAEEGALNTKFIRGLLSTIKGRGGYEAVADVLKPGNVTAVRRLRDAMEVSFPGSTALGKPWKHVQAEYNQRLLDSAMLTRDGGVKELRGAMLRTRLMEPEIRELVEEVYSPEHYQNLMKFADNLTVAQAKGLAGGRGKFMVEMKEGGAISNVAGGLMESFGLTLGGGAIAAGGGITDAATIGAGAVLAAPTLLGRAFTDPVIVKWLTEGLAHPRLFGKTRAASAATARLLAAEAEEIFLDDADMGSYERELVHGNPPIGAAR